MKGGEIFSVQLRNPITEIVLMFRDKSSTLTVKGVEYIKVGVADVAVTGGGSGGSRPYCRNRVSCHSCAPSSIQFTLDGCTVGHSPIVVARHS